MKFKSPKKLLKWVGIWVGIIAGVFLLFIWITDLWWVFGVIFRTTVTPEKAYEKFEHGRYGGWSWTPDGRIMYVKDVEGISHVIGAGTKGYTQEKAKTVIAIIDKDGKNNQIIKEIGYLPKMAKRNKRYRDLRAEEKAKRKGIMKLIRAEIPQGIDVEQELKDGTLDKLYPDPPLSHIGWVDWNAKNNKLVFVANDGKGKTGIAISDIEFKEVKWINYEGVFPKWSPDGKWIAYIKSRHAGDIYLMDINGESQKMITNGYTFDTLNWFPNGKRFVVDHFPPHDKKGAYSGMGIVDISTGKMRELGDGLRPSISPDGKWVIYTHGIMNLETDEHRKFTHQLGYPKWSPDGKYIIEGWEGGIHILDFENNLVKNLRSLNPNESGGENVIAAFKEGQ